MAAGTDTLAAVVALSARVIRLCGGHPWRDRGRRRGLPCGQGQGAPAVDVA